MLAYGLPAAATAFREPFSLPPQRFSGKIAKNCLQYLPYFEF